MLHLTKFVHSNTGKIVMSILLGFGLATFFRTICKDKNCFIFQAPKLDEIEGKIFKENDKCYKFIPESSTCDASKKSVEFMNSKE